MEPEPKDPRVVKPEHLRRGGRHRAQPLDPGTAAGGDEPLDLEGGVHEGVESGSVVLRDDDGRQWQLGRRHAELVGHRVRLRARVRTDVMTTAQQGVLVEVVEVLTVDAPPRTSPTSPPGTERTDPRT